MLKRLPIFALFSLVILCTPVRPQEGEWIRAQKTDDIEAFYQVEKVGTNELEVRVKVLNGRAKDVRVRIDIEHNGVQRGGGLILRGEKPTAAISLTVPARRTNVEKVTITASEITGIKIKRWLNEDLAKIEDKENEKRWKEMKKREKSIPGIRDYKPY
jgi:hypothetical protein